MVLYMQICCLPQDISALVVNSTFNASPAQSSAIAALHVALAGYEPLPHRHRWLHCITDSLSIGIKGLWCHSLRRRETEG